MWIKSFVILMFAVLSNDSFAVQCENIIIDDFRFEIQDKELQVSFLNGNFSKSNLKINFIKNKNDSNILSGIIQLEDKDKVCNKIVIDIDPIKLCRDASGKIESWRFVTYGTTDIISIVSIDATANPPVLLFNSRVCRTTVLSGRVFVQDSSFNGGTITGLSNSIVDPGIPEFPPAPEIPEIPLPSNIEENVSKEVNFDFYTVKLVNVHIDNGNPIITGEKLGVTIQDSVIDGSPTIKKEISIKDSLITGNGTYEGKAELWDTDSVFGDYFIPLIRNNLTGANDISGTFFLQREIEESIITGGVSRKTNNEIEIVAHVSDHTTSFDSSEFYGFGHIGAEIRENTFIWGYLVPPVRHGVLFESGLAL
ncbi:MAG: hypothetical protein WDA09_01740, partial [Bacteriovoracaceae bacterium]